MALPTPTRTFHSASQAPHPEPVWRGAYFLLAGGSLPHRNDEQRRRRRSFAVSLGAQTVLMGLMAGALAVGPPEVRIHLRAAPQEMLTFLIPPLAPAHVAPRPQERRKTPPRTLPPQPPKVTTRTAYPAAVAPVAALPRPGHVAPDPDPPPLVREPKPQPNLELGRFGAPVGLAPNAGVPLAVPELGTFGSTRTAPVTAAPVAVRVGAAGFDRVAAGGGGDRPDPRAVQPAGFSSGAISASPSAVSDGPVSLNHFAAARPVVAAEIPKPPPASAADFVPPEVLSWPTPVYTDEAAAHRIEGEVTLEVRLGADGTARVLRVLHSLGFGLEGSAAEAARQLKFLPARRRGEAVDFSVVLHINFRLAY